MAKKGRKSTVAGGVWTDAVALLERMPAALRLAMLMILLSPGSAWAQGTRGQEPGVRGARAQDRQAFEAARAEVDPEARVQALAGFAAKYPESALQGEAIRLEWETDLRFFPERTEEIHALATALVEEAPKGLERWLEQSRVADALASAGRPNKATPVAVEAEGSGVGKIEVGVANREYSDVAPSGVDLPAAQRWAEASVAAMTEASFRRETEASAARYKLGRVSSKELHSEFVGYRAGSFAALARVDLREGELAKAAALLEEALRIQPLSSEVNELRGELALARKDDKEALMDFERAEATGALEEPWRGEMMRLYTASGAGGGQAGLEEAVDELYRTVYPTVFTLPVRKLPTGGHTVLLELFTGSGCEPCVAADLAVDSLLSSYSRQDLVALEWDENIPRPDPLANRASLTRGSAYGVAETPAAFLDGESLPVAGAARADAENVVVGFADEIEQQAAQPSSWQLQVAATRDAGGVVTAQAEVHSIPNSGGAKVNSGTDDPGGGATAQAPRLHFALVEDHVRYSGENGVRFHRMVVRAVAEETAPIRADATRSGAGGRQMQEEVHFDPAVISAELRQYLDRYEMGNPRFGAMHFLTKELPIDPKQVAIVAWLEDAATHEVLQAAFAPVSTL